MGSPKGYLIEVPVTLSVAVCGTSLEEAKRIAREFANVGLEISGDFIRGYVQGALIAGTLPAGVDITQATLESPSEEPCDLLEEIEAK